MRVVLDANVVASGVCWDGEAYLCLVKLARRHAFAFGTEETLAETKEVTCGSFGRNNPNITRRVG